LFSLQLMGYWRKYPGRTKRNFRGDLAYCSPCSSFQTSQSVWQQFTHMSQLSL
jgi:hypothetical protein